MASGYLKGRSANSGTDTELPQQRATEAIHRPLRNLGARPRNGPSTVFNDPLTITIPDPNRASGGKYVERYRRGTNVSIAARAETRKRA
jgi:hypothetical protein